MPRAANAPRATSVTFLKCFRCLRNHQPPLESDTKLAKGEIRAKTNGQRNPAVCDAFISARVFGGEFISAEADSRHHLQRAWALMHQPRHK